jgi:tetratricopeptide (TPR) repeat protein
VLVWLAVALVPAFGITALVTHAHRDEQRALAREWQARGERALDQGNPGDAVEAFRTALRFSREDRTLRLRLAESLAASGRPSEARAYLLGLWQDQPGNGQVNLELGRLAARSGDTDATIRYYHDAIEGAWPDDVEARRRAARMELAASLVADGARGRAEPELIALAADLPPDVPTKLRVAALLSRAGLHPRALAVFDAILEEDPGNREALVGGGAAAFGRGDYTAAVRYLRRVQRPPLEGEPEEMLAVSRAVLALDPYQRRLASRDRAERTLRALRIASARLATCTASSSDLEPLSAELSAASRAHPRNRLARDLDQVDALLALAVRAEQAVEGRCGPPTADDRAVMILGARAVEGPA